MWQFRVVMDAPAFDQDLCLLQGVEDLAGHQFVPDLSLFGLDPVR